MMSTTTREFTPRTDEEILAAYHLVAKAEGVFVEPASAASIAGLLKSIEDGWVKPGSTVVCTVTGNGLKDVANAIKAAGEPISIPSDMDRLLAAFAEKGITVE